MKAFVTGVNGQLGYDVIKELNRRNIDAVGCGRNDNCTLNCKYYSCDISKEEDIKNILYIEKPDVIFHCAAWTNVDDAEDEENKEKVYNANVIGTRNISEYAKKSNSKVVYISTDYVFSGDGDTPWKADSSIFNPQNYYGETKLLGEQEIIKNVNKYYIVRISWVFGYNGNNFIKTMIKVGKNHDEVRVVNDQFGLPTYTYDLSKLLVDMIETDKYGIYHATNDGEYITWYDFTMEIYKKAGLSTKVIPVKTEEYGVSKAKRPKNTRLDRSSLSKNGFNLLPDWKDALERYLEEIKCRKF